MRNQQDVFHMEINRFKAVTGNNVSFICLVQDKYILLLKMFIVVVAEMVM